MCLDYALGTRTKGMPKTENRCERLDQAATLKAWRERRNPDKKIFRGCDNRDLSEFLALGAFRFIEHSESAASATIGERPFKYLRSHKY
jgi:hypothetical protein